jgi:hypothetical protein
LNIVIRPPESRRIVGFAAGVLLALVGFLWLPAALSDNPSGAIAVYGFLLFCAVYNSRWALSRVEVRGDELHVRNWVRNEVFRRDDVVGFVRVELDARPRGSRKLTLGEKSQIGLTVRGPRTILLNASVRGPTDTTSVDSWLQDLQKWRFSASAHLGAGNNPPAATNGRRLARPAPRAQSSMRGARPGGRRRS